MTVVQWRHWRTPTAGRPACQQTYNVGENEICWNCMLTLATGAIQWEVVQPYTAVVSKLESCSRVVLPQALAARRNRGGRENYDNYLPGLASQSRPDPGHMHYQHPAVGKWAFLSALVSSSSINNYELSSSCQLYTLHYYVWADPTVVN